MHLKNLLNVSFKNGEFTHFLANVTKFAKCEAHICAVTQTLYNFILYQKIFTVKRFVNVLKDFADYHYNDENNAIKNHRFTFFHM